MRTAALLTLLLTFPSVVLAQAKVDPPVSLAVTDVSLEQALDKLRCLTKANVVLDARANSVVVSMNASSRRLSEVVADLAKQAGLEWTVYEGVLYLAPKGNLPTIRHDPLDDGRLARRLLAPVTLTLTRVPLQKALDVLLAGTGIARAELEEHLESRRVSLQVRDLPLRSALTLLLHQAELTWSVDDTGLEFPSKKAWALESLDGRTLSLNLEETPFNEIAPFLRQVTELEVRLEGPLGRRQVTLTARQLPARQALDLLARRAQVAWRVSERGEIVFTPAEGDQPAPRLR